MASYSSVLDGPGVYGANAALAPSNEARYAQITGSSGSNAQSATSAFSASQQNFDEYFDMAKELADYTYENYDKKTMEYNSAEAEKTRQFEEYMSNTSHQREIKDLLAAGLNPVLSAKLGGASTPTTSAASVGQASASSSMNNALSTLINSSVSLSNKVVDYLIAENQNSSAERRSLTTAQYDYLGRQYQADTAYSSADNVAKINQETEYGVTNKNNLVKQTLQAQELEWKALHPSTPWSTVLPLVAPLVEKVASELYKGDSEDANIPVSEVIGNMVNPGDTKTDLGRAKSKISYEYNPGTDASLAWQLAQEYYDKHPNASDSEIMQYVHNSMLSKYSIDWNHEYG